jgi:hypothetical protein
MNRHRATALALVLAVLFAGCSGIGGSGGTTSPTGTTTSAATSSSTANTATTEMWIEPSTPQKAEVKSESGHIAGVKFVDKVGAKNGGYGDFDLRVTADTRFPNVDPKSDGEPYFLVKINGKSVARKNAEWQQKKNGEFTITILRDALDQFDSGTLTVRVTLLENDSHSDDKYDTWKGTIEYRSGG